MWDSPLLELVYLHADISCDNRAVLLEIWGRESLTCTPVNSFDIQCRLFCSMWMIHNVLHVEMSVYPKLIKVDAEVRLLL